MARGRMLSTETAVDPELNALTLPAYALYLATIPHLDRDGLITAHPVVLAATVAPLRYELREDAARLINEWIEIGLVCRYEVSIRQAVLFFKGFRRHQQGMEYGRETASRFPPPPGWTRIAEGLVPVDPELCCRLAESFHPKNVYRRVLIDAAGADVPTDDVAIIAVAKTSRSVREHIANTSRSVREHFAPKTKTREENNGGGGVQTYTPTTPGCGTGGGVGGELETGRFAGYSDDNLRLAANDIGSLLSLHTDYNGWQRLLDNADRKQLLLIICWCGRWLQLTVDELDAVRSLSAVLASKLKSGEQPVLTKTTIDNIIDLIDHSLIASAA